MKRSELFPQLFIARNLLKWIAVSTIYAVFVGYLVHRLNLPRLKFGDEIAAVLGFALGILLVFRTNTAYARWWEARTQWGQLVNDVRNLTLKSHAHAAVSESEFREMCRLMIAFPHALRLHLRGVDQIELVPGFADDRSGFTHPPGYIAGLVHETLNRWNRDGKLVETIWVLDVHARSLLDICGACERIRSTPLASSYRALVRWSIILYILMAPWSIFLDTGWVEMPILVIAMAFLIGGEMTAEVIEEPFGTDGDDLPLDGLCQTMESFVTEFRDSKYS